MLYRPIHIRQLLLKYCEQWDQITIGANKKNVNNGTKLLLWSIKNIVNNGTKLLLGPNYYWVQITIGSKLLLMPMNSKERE